MNWLVRIVVVFCLVIIASAKKAQVPSHEKIASYWRNEGLKHLDEVLKIEKIETVAKNVILFLGDGMGLSTVTATRIYKGQKKGNSGLEEKLVFDDFPYASISKTYGLDRIVSDSANTATAYLSGVKANYYTLGVDGRVEVNDCEASLNSSTHADSILKWSQDAGKSTGFVTTSAVTDATPAGLYAHTPNRYWDGSAPNPLCKDIAYQLVKDKPGKDINIIMGGGLKNFIPDTGNNRTGIKGVRKDGKDLLCEWRKDKIRRKLKNKITLSVDELKALNADKIDYVLGLFAYEHFPYVSDRPQLKRQYPSLPKMTLTALKILRKNPNGFFLLVEGASIDKAHHSNWGQKALEEGLAFDQAIQVALENTDAQDTLIVVTADHSSTFSIGGNTNEAYSGAVRGTSILGLDDVSNVDNKTYTILGYHDGPGFVDRFNSQNLTEEVVTDKDYRQSTAVPKTFATHGGEDVAVYAKGPMAHLYQGVHDQTYIPYVMAYAACIGPSREKCKRQP